MISGKTHWLMQRLSAIILIPLTLWFVYKFIKLTSYEYSEILNFFNSKTNSFLFCIMMLVMIYHGRLGMQTIIEDYISTINIRNKIIFIIKIFSYIIMLVSSLSIFYIQFYK